MSATRVLLVDDDPVFNDLMARGFIKRGFETRQAHNAEQAVELAAAFGPAL
ncbi:MAG: two-component system response regulator, partial [Halieaceae bacterium]|nr:two-component system response regulator [Halieaceae bacterium]